MTSLSILEFLDRSQSPVRNYVSASKLNLWLRCPLAFRRRYIDGVPSSITPSLFFGRVVHDVLDGIYRCAMLGAYTTDGDVSDFVDDAWERAMDSEPCYFESDEKAAKAKSQVGDVIRTYLAEIDIAVEKPIAVEQKYDAPLIDPATGEDFGIGLIGIIDLLLEEQPNEAADYRGRRQSGSSVLTLVDFKTAASASSNCELQHELQLTAYAYLVRHVYGRKESSLEIRQLVKTKTPKIVIHRYPPRNEEHFERFFGILREYLDALDRGIFNYRPSWNCSLCEHSRNCTSFLIPPHNSKEPLKCLSPSFATGN